MHEALLLVSFATWAFIHESTDLTLIKNKGNVTSIATDL